MEGNINRNNRLVIPKWRSFQNTKILGELSGVGNRNIPSFDKEFSKKKGEWKTKKDFISAMELLIYSNLDDVDVNEAKKYITGILGDNILDSKELIINKKISKIRKNIKEYPRNAIVWVDLSLCYTILGKEEKAIKAMKTALQLDCNNRFIIRSAVRLFLHYNKYDYAYYILKKNPLVKYDPWVNATYISVSQLLEKNIRNIDTSRDFIESKNFSNFDVSELACSLGYLELTNGKDKEAKKMFKQSIIKPNDNVAAQLQWISTNIVKIQDIEKISSEKIKNNFEFDTIGKCYLEDFDGAIESVEKWINDDMVSTTPNLVASTIYSSVFDDYDKSEEKINNALKKEKDNIKLNIQLAFCKIGSKEYSEAEKILNKVEKENEDKENQIFILADRGMLNFRMGNELEGEKLYNQAISLANQSNMLNLKGTALFHLAKEKHKVKSLTFDETLKRAKESYKYIKDPITLYNIKKFENNI